MRQLTFKFLKSVSDVARWVCLFSLIGMVINKFESTHIVAQNTKLNEILLFLWILTLMKPKTQDMNQRE